ncbi:autotransporter domain-containing protein, partial [Fusobacterium sp. THCT1E2]
MIEKIMKAVKSGNKKRGRNITIGVVIGFLLSCTAVMGEDNYLWIRENSGEIEFNTQKTTNANGAGGNWNKIHPYSDENIWDADTKTYINNMMLSSSEENWKNGWSNNASYGFRLSGDLGSFNFINNGSIAAVESEYCYGIYNDSVLIKALVNNGSIMVAENRHCYGIYNERPIKTLVNNGSIAAVESEDCYGIENNSPIKALVNNGSIMIAESEYCYGIDNYSAIKVLVNNGLIVAKATNDGYGIYNDSSDGSIENLINRGLIMGYGNNDESSGIYNCDSIGNLINRGLIIGYDYGILNISGSVIEILTNGGLITGTGNSSFGIYGVNIETLTNTGIIYGKNCAILNGGEINSAYNYGILVNGDDGKPVINSVTVINVVPDDDATPNKNEILNRGLIFTVLGEEEYKVEEDYKQFGTIHKDKELIVGYEKNEDGTLNLNNPIKESYTVINAKEKEGNSESNITGTESLSLDKGVLTCGNSEKINISSDKKYILNGITDTLKVAGTGNELNNSA